MVGAIDSGSVACLSAKLHNLLAHPVISTGQVNRSSGQALRWVFPHVNDLVLSHHVNDLVLPPTPPTIPYEMIHKAPSDHIHPPVPRALSNVPPPRLALLAPYPNIEQQ